MPRFTIIALCASLITAGEADAQPVPSDFESELEIVDESYFEGQPYVSQAPGPRTVIRGQAAWTPFDIARGFSTVHLMNEQACRNFLQNLRESAGTACMNVHSGQVFHHVDFIGPRMP